MIKACARLGTFWRHQIYSLTISIQNDYEYNVFVCNSLVDMYVKYESMEHAWKVFHKMPSQNVVLWTTILGGCAMHGHGKEALKHFEQMCEEGV